ncbi:MAG: hypothetical protein GEU74_12355 [Nitriliruptorales bacterium]|nr:hypothetical protein [Nitriliruptorales bacterium]
MTPALWLTLTLAFVAAVAYTLGAYGRSEDRADADWAWRVIDLTRHNYRRAQRKLAAARERPFWLPEPNRGRFIPVRDHALRRFKALLDEMRRVARKETT